jgi:hypothetical protein
LQIRVFWRSSTKSHAAANAHSTTATTVLLSALERYTFFVVHHAPFHRTILSNVSTQPPLCFVFMDFPFFNNGYPIDQEKESQVPNYLPFAQSYMACTVEGRLFHQEPEECFHVMCKQVIESSHCCRSRVVRSPLQRFFNGVLDICQCNHKKTQSSATQMITTTIKNGDINVVIHLRVDLSFVVHGLRIRSDNEDEMTQFASQLVCCLANALLHLAKDPSAVTPVQRDTRIKKRLFLSNCLPIDRRSVSVEALHAKLELWNSEHEQEFCEISPRLVTSLGFQLLPPYSGLATKIRFNINDCGDIVCDDQPLSFTEFESIAQRLTRDLGLLECSRVDTLAYTASDVDVTNIAKLRPKLANLAQKFVQPGKVVPASTPTVVKMAAPMPVDEPEQDEELLMNNQQSFSIPMVPDLLSMDADPFFPVCDDFF